MYLIAHQKLRKLRHHAHQNNQMRGSSTALHYIDVVIFSKYWGSKESTSQRGSAKGSLSWMYTVRRTVYGLCTIFAYIDMNLLYQPGSFRQRNIHQLLQRLFWIWSEWKHVKEDLVFSGPDAKPKTQEHFRTYCNCEQCLNLHLVFSSFFFVSCGLHQCNLVNQVLHGLRRRWRWPGRRWRTLTMSWLPMFYIWFNNQIRAMLDCNTDCWLNHPVAKLLAEGELDDYSRPHEEDTSGPRYFAKVQDFYFVLK